MNNNIFFIETWQINTKNMIKIHSCSKIISVTLRLIQKYILPINYIPKNTLSEQKGEA